MGIETPPCVRASRSQQTRDQEAGQDEEHIEADIAAAEEANAGVIEHDEEDGDGAETLEVVSKLAGPGRPSAAVSRLHAAPDRITCVSLLAQGETVGLRILKQEVGDENTADETPPYG